MIRISHLPTRNDFGLLLNEKGLTGIAAEIGTHRGVFAHALLSKWNRGCLFCIDPYRKTLPEYEPQIVTLHDRGQTREDDHLEAVRLLTPFITAERVAFERSPSHLAAKTWVRDDPKWLLDFVYIDADHRPEAVVADLERWWPLVRPGGILAGHDLAFPAKRGSIDDWGQGIRPVVREFAKSVGVDTVHAIIEQSGGPWSFFLEKS